MKDWHAALQLIAVGWYIALSLLIPFGVGVWLDKTKFHSFPRLTFAGIGIGTVVMVFGVYKMLKEIMKVENNATKSRNNKIGHEKTTTEETENKKDSNS